MPQVIKKKPQTYLLSKVEKDGLAVAFDTGTWVWLLTVKGLKKYSEGGVLCP